MNLGKATRGFLHLFFSNVITKIAGLISLGVFTRQLTTEELAFLPVYTMLGPMTYMFLGFGLQPTMIRRLPELLKTDRPTAGRMIRLCVPTIMSGTGLFSVGVFLTAPIIARKLLGSEEGAYLIRYTAVGMTFYTWRNTFMQLLWSASRFKLMASVRTTSAVGRAALGVVGLLIDGIRGLALAQVITDGVTLLMSIYNCRDLLRLPMGPGFSMGQLLRESLPFYFEGYLTYLRNQGDSLVVASFLGPKALGIYFVAKRLPLMLRMVMESLDKVTTSQLSQLRNDQAALTRSIHRILLPQVVIFIPAIFLLMGMFPQLIRLIAGPGFEAAVLPGMILCLLQLGLLITVPLSRGVFVFRPPVTRLKITSIESLFLIGTLALLVPFIQETGVAIARVAASLAALTTSYLILRNHLPVRFPWRPAILSLIISAVMMAMVLWGTLFYPGILPALLATAAGMVFFLVTTWFVQAEVFYSSVLQLSPVSLPPGLVRFLCRKSDKDR